MSNIPSRRALTALSGYLDQLRDSLSGEAALSEQERQMLEKLLLEAGRMANAGLGTRSPDAGAFLTELCRCLPEALCASRPLRSACGGMRVTSMDADELPTVLYLSSGRTIPLGTQLSRGGEGLIFRIPQLPGKVAKVFHGSLSADEACAREQKLRYLCTQKKNAVIGDIPIASLPDALLYTEDGVCCGYIMQYMPTTMKLAHVVRDDAMRAKAFPDLNYRGLIVIAYNLAEAVCHLHSHNIVIGDMNQNNILINPDGTIYLIDCDSFDVTDDSGVHHPCRVGISELLAPELQGPGRLEEKGFTRKSDCFTLAVHIFHLLMQNTDPFSFASRGCRYRSEPYISMNVSENQSILRGECVFFRDVPGKAVPQWAPPMELLPPYIVELFRRTFDYSADTIPDAVVARPTAREWLDALARFYQEPMKPCTLEPFHWYRSELRECPLCRAAARTDTASIKDLWQEFRKRSRSLFSKTWRDL